ncbi:hypothetical protein L9F63_013886, partial [Diploptera punctata]
QLLSAPSSSRTRVHVYTDPHYNGYPFIQKRWGYCCDRPGCEKEMYVVLCVAMERLLCSVVCYGLNPTFEGIWRSILVLLIL